MPGRKHLEPNYLASQGYWSDFDHLSILLETTKSCNTYVLLVVIGQIDATMTIMVRILIIEKY